MRPGRKGSRKEGNRLSFITQAPVEAGNVEKTHVPNENEACCWTVPGLSSETKTQGHEGGGGGTAEIIFLLFRNIFEKKNFQKNIWRLGAHMIWVAEVPERSRAFAAHQE